MKVTLRFLVGLFALCTAFLASAADDYPSRPITLIIPYPPAGTADVIGRPLADELSKRLKTPVIVDYKAGAGGVVGTEFVSRAAPDGYTLLLVLASHAINPSLYKLRFDPVKDFTPISLVAKLPLVLYTNPTFPPKTVKELIAYAKENPGRLSIASAGNGNTSHLAIAVLGEQAGIKILHVPYKGGGPSITAAIGGEVNAVFAGPDSLQYAKAGKLRMIGVAGLERWPYAPDVPAIAESLPNFEVTGWYGVVAPAKTPATIVSKLNQSVGAILRDPAFQKRVGPLGYTTTPSTPEQFEKFIRVELTRWGDVIRNGNIKLD